MSCLRLVITLVCLIFIAGCAQQKVVASDPGDALVSRLAKSDINEVVEIHQRAVMRDLQALMIKLYYRNPYGRHDKNKRSIEDSVALVFARPNDEGFEQWRNTKPTDIIRIALDPTYQGSDRVLPFIVGLRKMLMASYDNHTEFYYLTTIDQQKLYNSARNLEIAAWMLAENRDINGKLLILSDSLDNEQRNLSYQRLIGRMIATQDNLADIVSHKTGHLIKTVVLNAASLVFLPI
ncbi:MAG: hypothetical protein P1P93_09170 [Gammaproteobacteria bacterium]|nr:hypothetical protein [Gammaproteobacteria bacterium]